MYDVTARTFERDTQAMDENEQRRGSNIQAVSNEYAGVSGARSRNIQPLGCIDIYVVGYLTKLKFANMRWKERCGIKLPLLSGWKILENQVTFITIAKQS